MTETDKLVAWSSVKWRNSIGYGPYT